MLRPTLAAYLLLLVWGGGAWADAQELRKIHPSKIPPQQFENAKFCGACHKSVQGKFTHSAIQATGCVSCHEVKTENDQTVTSLVERGNALCLTCHSDKSPAETKGRMHSPVADGECTTCHNPHAGENRFLLVQPTSGGKAENLCLMCHDIGVDVPKTGSRHAALDLGCDACHATHKTGEMRNPEFANHLTKAAPALCLDCHDASDKTIADAHGGQPIVGANCITCHSPHASDRPRLTFAYAHPPFAEKQCDACHEAAKGNQVAVIEGGKRALCYMCHDAMQQQISSAKHAHGVFTKTDSCTTCHSPHATKFPKYLKQAAGALCESCHTRQAQQRATKKFLHPPAFQTGCMVCHEPHATNFTRNLRAEVNELCLTCHGSDARGEAGSDANAVLLFGGAVRLPGDYLATVKHLPLRRGGDRGHPQAEHPIVGKPDPSNPGNNISCVSCHDAHAADGSVRMFVTQTKSSTPLCIRCHQ